MLLVLVLCKLTVIFAMGCSFFSSFSLFGAGTSRLFKSPPSSLSFNAHGTFKIIRLSAEQADVSLIQSGLLLSNLDLTKVFLLSLLLRIEAPVDIRGWVLRQLRYLFLLARVLHLLHIELQRLLHSTRLSGERHSSY